MKTQAWILTCALIVIAGWAQAAPMSPSFDDANTEFAQKNYARAANDDQALIARQGYSAPVLFNLANAEFQAGQLGLAILNYERAQLLAPRDTDIAANLQYARTKAGLADRPIPWFERTARSMSLNAWSWIAAVAALFIVAGWAVGPFAARHRFGQRAVMVTSAAMLLAAVLAVGVRWSELNRAIVIVKQAPVSISPVTVAQPVCTLAEGQPVALGQTHGDFVLVKTSDGQRGWMKRADVSPLIPPATGTHITWM